MTATVTTVPNSGRRAMDSFADRPPLHALHVLPGFGLGGCERVVADFVRKLPARGVRCSVCVLGQADGFAHWLGNVKPVFLGHSGAVGDVRSSSVVVERLRQVIAEIKPDIVHTHLWPADFIGATALRGSGILHVAHQHGAGGWWRARGLRPMVRRMLTRRLFRGSGARLIAVSEAVARHVAQPLRRKPQDVTIIHNGVDVEAFAPVQATQQRRSTRTVLAAAGRFSSEKGFDRLIEAAAQLVRAGRDVEIHLAGSGSHEARYRDLAQQHGIADHLTLAGPVNDIHSFYAAADIFILPSLSEGLPLTLLEAMATARPVVATRVGGIPEVVTDGVDGLLVPSDDINALAAALDRLITNHDLAAQLAAAGRRRVVADFDLDRTIDRLVAFYRALMSARAHSPDTVRSSL